MIMVILMMIIKIMILVFLSKIMKSGFYKDLNLDVSYEGMNFKEYAVEEQSITENYN